MLCSNRGILFGFHFNPIAIMENDSALAREAGMKLNFSKPAVFADYGGTTEILCSIFHGMLRVRLPLPSI